MVWAQLVGGVTDEEGVLGIGYLGFGGNPEGEAVSIRNPRRCR